MDIGIGIALLAGFLSFASPCVLPIVPGYLTFITGLSFDELSQGRSRVILGGLLKSLPFVLGFSLVFIALGAGASALSVLLRSHLGLLKGIAGAGIMLLGLHLTGLVPIPGLSRERRFSGQDTPPGMVRAFVAGLLFAFGWTPCVGPILAAILALAATAETLGQGVLLLAVYSLGLGIPFILAAAFLNGFLAMFGGLKAHLRRLEIAGGVLLMVVGVLVFNDKMSWLSSRLTFLNPEELLVATEPAASAAHNPAESRYGSYNFTLTTIDSEQVSLADYYGKVVLVNFWAPWCGPCVVETPALVRMYDKYKSQGFAVIGVALQSEEDGVKQFVETYRIPYAIGRDTEQAIGPRYQVFALPSSFLFSPDGKVKRAFTGFIAEEALEAELKKLLPAPPPQRMARQP